MSISTADLPPEIAEYHDWRRTDHARRLHEMFDTERAEHLLSDGRNWSNATIAKWTGVPEVSIEALRYMRLGAVPNVSHGRLIWLLGRYADHHGHHAHTETGIALGGRKRLIPDVVICHGLSGPVAFVVEVKTRLQSRGEIVAAVEQVTRYRKLIGQGTPVVTAYSIPTPLRREIDGVKVWPASRLVAEIKALSQESVTP